VKGEDDQPLIRMVSLNSNEVDEALNQNEKNHRRYILKDLDLTPNNDEKEP
jgi:hypothetical protein